MDGLNLQTREASDVAMRVLVLASLMDRVAAEIQTIGEEHQVLRQAQEDIQLGMLPWMRGEGVWEHTSAIERYLFEQPVGSWTQQECVVASWRNEALCMLLWSLGLVNSAPPYDREWQIGAAMDQVPLGEDPRTFVEQAKLRPAWELHQARDAAELWHWRGNTERIRRGEVKLEVEADVDDAIAMTTRTMVSTGMLTNLIDNDFPAYGRAYRDLSPDQFSFALSVALERHYAMNWVCAYGSDWDDVPVDT